MLRSGRGGDLDFFFRRRRKQKLNSGFSATKAPKIFFLHFMKTGGTSVHQALSACFPKEKICPNRGSVRDSISDSELKSYDFISGHFSVNEAIRAKEFGFKTIVLLRSPIERLMSMYNFFAACNPQTHPAILDGSHSKTAEVQAIQTLSASNFFTSDIAVNSIYFNNYYFQVFSNSQASHIGALRTRKDCHVDMASEVDEVLQSVTRVFDEIVTIENAKTMVNSVRRDFNLPDLDILHKVKVTADEMQWHEWMQPVKLLQKKDLKVDVRNLILCDELIFRPFE